MKIKSIRKIGKRKTFDLVVPGLNNFFLSNGVLSHNSGKSFKLKACTEFCYEKGYKLWDMFGGKRGEGPFWCFPSDEMKMWREYEKCVGVMSGYGPKEYPVLLVYPYFKDTFPKELPEKKPRISCKAMTIYFKDITIQDISIVIGEVSSNAKYVWNYIIKNLPDDACGQDILNLFIKTLKRYKELTLYKSFIQPLCEQQILVGKNFVNEKYGNLDLISESKKKEEVFILCDDYTPREFRLFIMGYILRKLFYDIIMLDKTHNRNIALFREMSLFMKLVDASSQDGGQIQNFRNLITDIARYARSGLFIFGDTQSPQECKNLISGSEDLVCISELPSPGDREAACEQLRRDMRISPGQIAYIATMSPFELVVVERGENAVLIKRMQPPRTKCWKQDDINFLSTWKKLYNEYLNTTFISNEIQQLYNLASADVGEEEVIDEEDVESEDEKELKDENSDSFDEYVEQSSKEFNDTTEKQQTIVEEKITISKEEKEKLRLNDLKDKIGDYFS